MKAMEKARLAREASRKLMIVSLEKRNSTLDGIAKAIKENSKYILSENEKDMKNAAKLSSKGLLQESLVSRLKMSGEKLQTLCKGIIEIARMQDPINRTTYAIELDKGLELSRITCPIGVICVVFEARPDALVQIASLCLKSGNAVILKGGSEARNSNAAFISVISKAAADAGIPEGWISMLQDRGEFDDALKMDDYIDLVIARGSKGLVEHVLSNTRIPVMGHTEGLCHIYVDKSAKHGMAIDICIDSKTNYPAACNSVRYILVNKDIADSFIPELAKRYAQAKVKMRCSDDAISILDRHGIRGGNISRASEKDWTTEFLDMTAAVMVVEGLDGAIEWINDHSSRHTDAIITQDKEAAGRFASMVDSSSVMVNASTRFADGYRYGFGAEVGVNTGKMHARGPVGIEGLVTYKYVLIGRGHVVGDYMGKNAKGFTHKLHKV